MNELPLGGPRRPYWVLPALLVLLSLPSSWAYAALGAALAVRTAWSLARRAARRRREPTQTAGGADSIRLGVELPGLGLGARIGGGIGIAPASPGRAVSLNEAQLSAHGLILGASGAGKTTTLLRILTEHVLRGGPVVAIDMKGSPAFARQLRGAAVAAGRPFRLWTPDGPDHWNPLQHGNATELKDKLISTERFTEPHYQRAAERYVQTVLQVLQSVHPRQAPTLAEVVGLMDPPRLAGVLRRLPHEHSERVHDYLATMTSDQLSAVRGLGTRLAIISESATGPYLAPEPERMIDLRAALDGREVVLFSLNASLYGKLSAQLGTLAIQDLIAASGHRLAEPGAQALIGIDEFSALGADNLVALLARGRESGNSVMLATQELADLERAARGFRDQVLGVTAIKIIHRQEVHASARTIADMIGTQKVWEPTYRIGGGPLGAHSTSRGTRRQVERYLLHPDVIKSLRTGEAIVSTKIPESRVWAVRVERPRDPGITLSAGVGDSERGDRAGRQAEPTERRGRSTEPRRSTRRGQPGELTVSAHESAGSRRPRSRADGLDR